MYKYFKLLVDLLFALILLIILLPIFIPILFILYFHFKGNPIFRQKRIGYKNKEFLIFKLKTMRDIFDKNGDPLPDRERITNVGSFIRKLSLDEIPQILNVIKGEMSFIGPRPLSPKLMPYYTEVELLRHKVRPGITGWAQINGRNNLDWDKRLNMDVYYYKNQSFSLDLKIFFLTVKNVLTRKDISSTPQIPSLIKTRNPQAKTVNDD